MRSASPAHLPRQSAPQRVKKATGRGEAAAQAPAAARAASVLPVPGGPQSSTPLRHSQVPLGGMPQQFDVKVAATCIKTSLSGTQHLQLWKSWPQRSLQARLPQAPCQSMMSQNTRAAAGGIWIM